MLKKDKLMRTLTVLFLMMTCGCKYSQLLYIDDIELPKDVCKVYFSQVDCYPQRLLLVDTGDNIVKNGDININKFINIPKHPDGNVRGVRLKKNGGIINIPGFPEPVITGEIAVNSKGDIVSSYMSSPVKDLEEAQIIGFTNYKGEMIWQRPPGHMNLIAVLNRGLKNGWGFNIESIKVEAGKTYLVKLNFDNGESSITEMD